MKMKLALTIALTFCLLTLSSHADQLTNFGSSTFNIDSDFTSFIVDQQATKTLISGIDDYGCYIIGYFPDPIDISTFSQISLTASISEGNPQGNFSLILFDDSFDMEQGYVYTGNTSDFGIESTSQTLSLASFGFADLTRISGLMFIIDDYTTSGFSMTLESVDAIPEPSMAMLSAVGLGAAFLLRRKRWGAALPV